MARNPPAGEPPRPEALPSGCRFRLRCPYTQDDPCATHEPTLTELSPGHQVACHVAQRTANVVLDAQPITQRGG